MMSSLPRSPRGGVVKKVISQTLLVLMLAGLVAVLMLWLTGAFEPKVSDADLADSRPRLASGPTAAARYITVQRAESAPGTVRPVHEAAVASKLFEKVESIQVRAGQRVKKGQLLVTLDKTVWQNRLEQAQAALDSSSSALKDAQQDLQRLMDASAKGVATKMEVESGVTRVESMQADVRRAQRQLDEAGTTLDYTQVTSPMDGVVVDKKVSQGDTVSPGQVLLVLYDPDAMQLVATVRESLARRLQVGQEMDVVIGSQGPTCRGKISEIVPEAEAASRSFSVKVTGPCPPEIYAGMYGRMVIPMGDEQVLVVPAAALAQVGQLTMVEVLDERGGQSRRAVLPGRRMVVAGADLVEILSGLAAGEVVILGAGSGLLPPAQPASAATRGAGQ